MSTFGHPTTDPGDGRTLCPRCQRYVHMIIHSCGGLACSPPAQTASVNYLASALAEIIAHHLEGTEALSQEQCDAAARAALAYLHRHRRITL